jgi:hypothetical protein
MSGTVLYEWQPSEHGPGPEGKWEIVRLHQLVSQQGTSWKEKSWMNKVSQNINTHTIINNKFCYMN